MTKVVGNPLRRRLLARVAGGGDSDRPPPRGDCKEKEASSTCGGGRRRRADGRHRHQLPSAVISTQIPRDCRCSRRFVDRRKELFVCKEEKSDDFLLWTARLSEDFEASHVDLECERSCTSFLMLVTIH